MFHIYPIKRGIICINLYKVSKKIERCDFIDTNKKDRIFASMIFVAVFCIVIVFCDNITKAEVGYNPNTEKTELFEDVYAKINESFKELKNEQVLKTNFETLMKNSMDIADSMSEIQKPTYQSVEILYSGTTKTYEHGNINWASGSMQAYYMSTMIIRYDGIYTTSDGYLAVAMGSYFGEIGTRYIITLENGNKIKVIKTDAKADVHSINGYVGANNLDILEFIVHSDIAMQYYGSTNGYIANGNFNNIPEFNGAIIKIERVVE